MANDSKTSSEKEAPKKEQKDTPEEIPEDIKEFIKKKEAETGKKYVYRPRRDESIQDMLAHGAPESRGKPVSFWGMIMYPLILLVLFIISLAIFHMAPQSKFGPGRFRLPPRGSRQFHKQPPAPVVEQEGQQDGNAATTATTVDEL